MSIFNKRNALVGYTTIEALKFRSRAKKRKTSKVALYVGLGLISAGILAAVVAVLFRRRNGEEANELKGYAVADDAESAGHDEPIPAVSSEPIPAT
jgi:hypothetical protein